MGPESRLTVRRFERRAIELPVEFVIADEHQGQVRFSAASEAAERFGVAGRSLDISPGGVGMVLAQFLPRMCEGWVRVLHPTSPGRAVLIEHRAKVRRVQLASHEPTYFVGVAFVEPDPALQQGVREIVDALSQEADRADGEADA